MTYRPKLIAQWENEKTPGWQPELWRQIVDRHGSHHLLSAVQRSLRCLETTDAQTLPRRLSLFGIDHLPPLYLHAFTSFAKHIDTALFVRGPSPHFWEDLVSKREKTRTAELQPVSDDVFFEADHALLSSWGTSGRDFDRQLSSLSSTETFDRFEKSKSKGTLGELHRSTYELRNDATHRTGKADHSIQAHACSTRRREIEVLHDRITELLENEPDLQVEDIHILAPDIQQYATELRAVFGSKDRKPNIPLQVPAIRGEEEKFVADFVGLAETCGGRLSVADVFDLFRSPILDESLRIPATDLMRARRMMERAGVRWGIDSSHREKLGLPRNSKHTWAAAFGRLGSSNVPEDDEPIVSKLVALVELVENFSGPLNESRSPGEWSELLMSLLSTFIPQTMPSANGHRIVRESLRSLQQNSATFEHPVDLSTALRELADSASDKIGKSDGDYGGVVCADLEDVCLLEAKVICLIGMGGDSFPRADKRPAFDLRKRSPTKEDESVRDRDLYAFLNAALSAQTQLVVVFSESRSSRSETLRPPLIEELENWSVMNLEQSLIVEHPDHGHAAAYFDSRDPNLFTYHKSSELVATAKCAAVQPPDPIPSTKSELSIDKLVAWLWNPAREYYLDRHGLSLFDSMANEDATDPIDPDALALFKAGQHALRIANKRGMEAASSFLTSTPELPAGSVGEALASEIAADVAQVHRFTDSIRDGAPANSVEIEIESGGVLIRDTIDNLYGSKLVQSSFSRPGGRSELEAWVRHLCAASSVSEVSEIHSTVVTRGKTSTSAPVSVVFSTPNNPAKYLEKLITLYASSSEGPVSLPPKATRAYVETKRSKSKRDPLTVAKQAYSGMHGDIEDPHVRSAFGDDPFSDESFCASFEESAESLYSPLFEHRGEE